MSISETISSFASGAVDWNKRPVALNFGRLQGTLGRLLALQHANVHEGLMTGIHGHLTCVSPRHDLSPTLFIGVPVSVRLVTDRGQLHTINAIIQNVQIGQSDGELCVYQLTVCDALSLMDKRTNSRVFRKQSVVDILTVMFNEWRQRSPALARAFEFDLSFLNRDRYPPRELTRQVNESDAAFVRRLLRREGISIFAKAGAAKAVTNAQDETPVHTLICCDNPDSLQESAAGTVRLHPRDAGTEERDAVTLFALHARLVPGATSRPSWDYKKARIDESTVAGSVDQGEAGNDLAKLLTDVAIDIPHAGDSWDDHERLTRSRMLAHQFEAEQYDGASGIRDLAVGTWITLTGDPELDMQSADKLQFVITSIRHDVSNNLPKGLTERVQMLFAASKNLVSPSPTQLAPSSTESDTRYENTFTCVRRGVPITPAYDPKIDLPPVHLLTGVIVTRDGDEVVTDELGRVYVRIQGLDAADHSHAQGAGTNDNAGDSAPVRVASSLAGTQFGASFLPRIGMEVLLGAIGGDPDRLVIIAVLGNGANPPTAFTHTGSLPGNRYVSGIKTKEIKGQRYNQLRLDDTPGQISSQLASEHAHSQLNLGYLTQPRQDGQGKDRGEGAELRTDAAAALRAAQGILLTTYARSQASGGQLDRDELLQLLGECTELFKSLGDYAGEHGGQATDTAGQQAVVSAFKSWTPAGGGSGTGADGTGGSQALIAFGAQAGSVAITPKTHVTYAGENIDQVAQQHVQLSSGQRINLHGGRGVAMFAHSDGVSAIANQGKVTLQSQADDTQIDSAKNIQFTAADGKITGMANDQVVFTTSGGAYLKLHGSDIELGCPGKFTVKSAGHSWQGPASMSTDMPKFDHAPLGRVPKLVRASDGNPIEGYVGEVHKASGEIVNGQTDSAGTMAPIDHNQFEQVVVKFFKKDA
ncbi:MAG: Actin cross-linking toxin VgrG1 [Burkholderia lata]|uniref:Actin cross-linking toxin VgrG1 n=1 Tax=Burkholderia lata (strain ATCC 17760 / DSM 23089 / LMG 22485 / NCIMB 9086 / R18194 / 383) TaxID=482957 RepID=A0A833PTJ2_BURL3|nr:type VI secretion system Vgr family protein [Burkholderia lata]KAF1036782.1 MAG: Actin cross-linking toxin VgrG1 [Burkholderia lata]